MDQTESGEKTSHSFSDMDMETTRPNIAIASMRSAFTQFDDHLQLMQQDLERKDASIRSFKLQLDESVEKIIQQEQQAQKLKNDLRAKEASEFQFQRQIEELSKETQQQRLWLQEKEKLLNEKTSDLNQLKQKCDDWHDIARRNESKIGEQDQSLNEKDNLIAELKREIEQLNKKLDDGSYQFKIQLNEATREIFKLKDDYFKTANDKRKAEDSLIDLSKKYQELDNLSLDTNQKYELLLKKNEELLKKLEEYSSENIQVTNDRDEFRTKYYALQESMTKTKDQSKIMENQLLENISNIQAKNQQEMKAIKSAHEQEIATLRSNYGNRIRQLETELKDSEEMFLMKQTTLNRDMQKESEQRRQAEILNKQLQQKFDQNQELLKQHEDKIGFLREKNKFLSKEIDELKKSHAVEKQILNQSIQSLENDKNELLDEIRLQTDKLATLEANLEQYKLEVSGLQDEVYGLNNTLESLNKDKLSTNAILFNMDQELKKCKDELSLVNHMLGEKDQKLEHIIAQHSISEKSLLKQNDQLVAERNDLRHKNQKLDRLNSCLKTDVEDLNKKLIQAKNELNTLKEDVKFLNDNVRIKSDSEVQYVKEIKELKEKVDKLSQERNRLFNECQEQSSLNNEQSQQLNGLVERLKEDLIKKEALIETLEQSVKNDQERVQHLQSTETKLLNENKELENCLAKYNLIFKKYLPDISSDKRCFRAFGSLQILDPEEIRKIFIQFNSRWNEIENTNVDYEQELDVKERMMSDLKLQFEQASDRAGQLEQKLRSFEKENSKLRSDIEFLRKQFDSKEKKLTLERKNINDKLVDLQRLIKDVRQEKQLLQDENDSLNSLKNSIESKLCECQSQMKKNEMQINELKSELYQHKLKFGQVTSENISKGQDIALLRERLEQCRTDLLEARESLNNAESSLSQSSFKKKQFESSIYELQQKLCIHENSCKEFVKKVNRLEEQVDQLMSENDNLKKEIQNKNGVLGEFNQTNQELLRKIGQMDDDLSLYRNMLNKFCLPANERSPVVNGSSENGYLTNGTSHATSKGDSGLEASSKNGSNKVLSQTKQLRFEEKTNPTTTGQKSDKFVDKTCLKNLDHLNDNLKSMTMNCKDVQKRIRSLQNFMESEDNLNENTIADSLSKLLQKSNKHSSNDAENDQNQLNTNSVLDNINRILDKSKKEFQSNADKILNEMKQLEQENEQLGSKMNEMNDVIDRTDAEESAAAHLATGSDTRARKLKDAQKYAESVIKQQEHTRKRQAQLIENKMSALKNELFQSFDPSCTPALFKKPTNSHDHNQFASTPMPIKSSSDRVKQRLDHKFK